jgi:hypothetical protein
VELLRRGEITSKVGNPLPHSAASLAHCPSSKFKSEVQSGR